MPIQPANGKKREMADIDHGADDESFEEGVTVKDEEDVKPALKKNGVKGRGKKTKVEMVGKKFGSWNQEESRAL